MRCDLATRCWFLLPPIILRHEGHAAHHRHGDFVYSANACRSASPATFAGLGASVIVVPSVFISSDLKPFFENHHLSCWAISFLPLNFFLDSPIFSIDLSSLL